MKQFIVNILIKLILRLTDESDIKVKYTTQGFKNNKVNKVEVNLAYVLKNYLTKSPIISCVTDKAITVKFK
jgi:hypothetical protein